MESLHIRVVKHYHTAETLHIFLIMLCFIYNSVLCSALYATCLRGRAEWLGSEGQRGADRAAPGKEYTGATYIRTQSTFTCELCSWTHYSLEDIVVLTGTTGAGRMAPPTSTRISARLKCVQQHSSRVNICSLLCMPTPDVFSFLSLHRLRKG